MGFPYLGAGGSAIDTADQPLIDAWWTAGWTAQNMAYQLSNFQNPFVQVPFPSDVKFINVTENIYDEFGNGLAGYYTFEPSGDILLLDSGTGKYFRMPRRLSGYEPPPWGYNSFGSGRIYIRYGMLNVYLMATDTPGMTITDSSGNTPANGNGTTFTYHVREYFEFGREYDITVPGATTSPVDINTLIVPGTTTRNYFFTSGA